VKPPRKLFTKGKGRNRYAQRRSRSGGMDGERYPLFLHVLNVEPHAIVRAKRHQILNPGILRGQRLLVIAILKDLRHILAKDGARPLRRERERPAALRRITGDRQRSAPRQRGGADDSEIAEDLDRVLGEHRSAAYAVGPVERDLSIAHQIAAERARLADRNLLPHAA